MDLEGKELIDDMKENVIELEESKSAEVQNIQKVDKSEFDLIWETLRN